MADKTHSYQINLLWTGNTGTGTSGYRAYERAHEISVPGKTPILGSSDPAFRGAAARYNPEELLVASLSACHMLWVLHLAAEAGITITRYADDAEGVMVEDPDGGGRFVEVVLRPRHDGCNAATAAEIHARAHAKCFIARSVAFPVKVEPQTA